ncbi:hypothetical protein ISO70_04185 [Morganella morganii subsp. morganii]|uniref:hypothetical protein n=1 Tax=Morganella TaxID=581 RepID=UPI000426B20F|nr:MULTISPECIES: hypothetical protein [Morganella]ELA9132451.1 hypothetical protein [Morganella morganii]ETO43280.1 hypothetical protein X965_17045 [Morganella sp. EGD-HP17]MBT0351855.1 hypothetical protein [Morganella morganii subsp. morganii]MDU0992070.1 hypothetical protein [Morganella morganii]MDU1072489.1 hypothetical protein [Morganella morganii]
MYDSSHLFSSFIKGGEQTEYDRDILLYAYELDEDIAECKDFERFEKALKEVNSSCSLRIEGGKLCLEFEAGSEHWQDDFMSYFYPTLDNFMRVCVKKRSIPSKFCILDRKLSESDTDDSLLKKVIQVTKWVKLLSDMADHIQDNNVLVFFVHHKEGKTKPYQINPFVDLQVIEELELDCDESRYERLHGSWHLEDAQTKDRQSVMLVSFAEIMSSMEDGENPFKVFLSSTKKFHDRYCENYEIYVNRFTVDSQLREIDEQHLSFIGKLQDLVTSLQTKAFALPGVMVAIGALARTNNFLGIVAIVVGVVMTKILIAKSNELLHENLNHFKDTFDRALGHYVKSRTEAEEVKSHAMDAQKKLDTQLNKAKGRVDFIGTMSNWMLGFGLVLAFIMLILVFKTDHPEEVKAIWDWGVEMSKIVCHWTKAKLATL